MIRLRNEGPMRPAPLLEGQAQTVSTEVQSWPGVISATHWQSGNPTIVDGAEFHVKDRGELGHIHLNGEIHFALTRTLRDLLVELHVAKPFVYHKAWITAPIKLAREVDQAIWLFKLGYDRLCSTSESVLSTRIRDRAQLNTNRPATNDDNQTASRCETAKRSKGLSFSLEP